MRTPLSLSVARAERKRRLFFRAAPSRVSVVLFISKNVVQNWKKNVSSRNPKPQTHKQKKRAFSPHTHIRGERKQRPKGYYYYYSYTTSKMFSSNNTRVLFDEGFVRSASMILASEIGDKTFFIAAVMAMTHSRATVRREFGFQFT